MGWRLPPFPNARLRSLPRGLSLASRIILINSAAMALMVAGLFYFGHYMDRFISAEVINLTKQAELMANTIGEVAVDNTPEGDVLRVDATRQIVRRLIETTEVRTQVFAPNSLLVADSRLLLGAGRYVQIEQLAPPQSDTNRNLNFDWVEHLFDWAAMLLPFQRNLPLYVETTLPSAEQMPDVTAALHGEKHWTLWNTKDQQLILTVAVPIQRVRQVVGVVMLSHDSQQTAQAIKQLRSDLLRIFTVMLGMSTLLSLYLAQTIARPLRRLARAATGAGMITGERPHIPNYTKRGDEIGHLSFALRTMTDALWQRLDAIERFAADVSHELKNPLTSMHSAIETLGRVKDDAQRQKLLHIVQDDVRRMERLITDISAISRLEAELARSKSEIINLADFAETIVSNRAQTGSAIVFGSEGKYHRIHGMKGQIAQVLENLIANALSFSPSDAPVVVTVREKKKTVQLLVEDEGRGLPTEKEEKIFERFYSDRPEGEQFGTHSGLGLNICRQIVEGLGGQIRAENRINSEGKVLGARFIVELPRILDK